jgi:thiol-disulfide isomerase/thioredoxin
MKRIFTLLLFVSLATVSFGQLEDYSKVPNFTGTDLQDNTHELYKYLDEGKVVIVDVFAAWCAPCWSYHTQHILEDAYTMYGPGGTNELMVMAVEAEGTNTVAQITGTVANQNRDGFTTGDWTAGVTYPIIDNRAIGIDILKITYFPTLYMIFPNRLVIEMGQQPLSVITDLLEYGKTQKSSHAKDISVISYTGDEVACGDADLKVRVQNMGFDELTEATVTVSQDGVEIISYPYSGSLAQYDVAELNLGSVNVSETTSFTIDASVVDDGNEDNDIFAQEIGSYLGQTNMITLNVTTDFYPAETVWSVKDGNGAVLATDTYQPGTADSFGGGGPDANKVHTYELEVGADPACYSIEYTDAYGDGMTQFDPAQHPVPGFELLNADGSVIKPVQEADWNFENDNAITFGSLGVSSADDIETISEFVVSPNPAYDRINLNLTSDNANSYNVMITDMMGKVVYSNVMNVNTGRNNQSIDISNLAKGMYSLSLVEGTKGIKTTTIVKM